MAKKRSLGKSLALGCGGLILLVVVLVLAAYLGLRLTYGGRSRSALARLKASGAPTTWEQVIPPPVPDDQNAALLYVNVFAFRARSKHGRVPISMGIPAEIALKKYLAASTRRERKALETEARQILAGNVNALASLRDAARLPKCRFNRDYRNPMDARYPEYVTLKDLSLLASAQAVLRADGGDIRGALEAWSLNLPMLDHLGTEPTLFGSFSRYFMLGTAADALRPILQQSRPTPEQCRSLAQALGKVHLDTELLKELEAERTTSLWILDYVRRNPQSLSTQGSSPWIVVWYPLFADLDEAAMLGVWENQMALLRKPYRQIAGRLDTLESEQYSHVPGHAVITRAVGPRLGRQTMARDRAIARVGLMQIGLGLAAYRARQAAYPDTLAALRESLKWQVPQDPFSGRDFVYHRKGAGYLLYSIGPNLKDDSGTPASNDPSGKPLGDIVWRVER